MTARCLILLLLIISGTASAAIKAAPIVCTQEYALCSSARCVPDPRDNRLAICSCVVEHGASAGYTSCSDRKPRVTSLKVRQLTSTFSFQQSATKKSLSCARGNPWTNCLDAPCTVDPMHPDLAICSCPIHHNQDFVTFGGECDQHQCENGFWSGADPDTSQALRGALPEKMNKEHMSSINLSCPAEKKQ